MTVDAVIFDIGDVLIRLSRGKAEKNFQRLGAASEDQAMEIRALGPAYEKGIISDSEFLRRVREILKYEGADEELRQAWQEMFAPNEPMWDVVEALHGRHPLYLLSNTNGLHHEYLVREYPVFEKFDDGVFSYLAGMSKPEPEIFEFAIRQFGVRPERTIYVDDLAPNVAAARAAGFLAINYHPDAHEDFLTSMRKFGVQTV